ncbi:hypothetical protein [Lyngbya sp. CCY1209]|uniref:hypothetical protein n=1 Tax=Lyngbya sp. CCY1209 TaxID=2886103 RepID=UPI002D21568C|nr:hypothetical protein [Lyngbya sp. CCY1209]MEB3887162.1 hypothetical protein [Lyngbya sp. CCY1209]
MKDKIDAILNGLIPSITQNVSTAAQTVRDGTKTMITPGAGLINKGDGNISQNPQAFGFAFEHLQAIGFNINAALHNSDSRAYQIPADGTTKYSPDIYVDKVGEVIAEIQAKAGSAKYVEKQANSGHYRGDILTNVENQGIAGTVVVIDVDGIKSIPVSQDVAVWVAENPNLAAEIMNAAATVGEIGGAGVEGAAVNASINILLQSIKVLGAYCRGEQELAREELDKILSVTIAGLKSGFIRGVAIKVLQKLMGGNAVAALGFTVGVEVFPVVIQVLQDEITLDRAIAEVGPRAFTSGVITTAVLLFPPVGAALLGVSVLQAIWQEIDPKWKKFVVTTAKTTVKASQKGVEAGAKHIGRNPWDLLGSSAASSAASAEEMQGLQDELDLLLD